LKDRLAVLEDGGSSPGVVVQVESGEEQVDTTLRRTFWNSSAQQSVTIAGHSNGKVTDGATNTSEISRNSDLIGKSKMEPDNLKIGPANVQIEPVIVQNAPDMVQNAPAIVQIQPAKLQNATVNLQSKPISFNGAIGQR